MEASGLVLALDFRKAVTVRFLSGTLFCSYSSNVTISMWEDGLPRAKTIVPQNVSSSFACLSHLLVPSH